MQIHSEGFRGSKSALKPYTLHRFQLKMDHRITYKIENKLQNPHKLVLLKLTTFAFHKKEPIKEWKATNCRKYSQTVWLILD